MAWKEGNYMFPLHKFHILVAHCIIENVLRQNNSIVNTAAVTTREYTNLMIWKTDKYKPADNVYESVM